MALGHTVRIWRDHKVMLAAVFLGCAAFVISVAGSWTPSMWGDEAASQLSARRSISSLFAMLLHVDAVHGTYYLMLHGWVWLFGYSAFAIRLPSAIAVGVCATCVAWSCARLASLRVGIIAGVVCAVLPRITYAGGEARSFALDAALASVLFVVVVSISRRPGPHQRLWVAYGVILAIATYLFIYSGLIALAVGGFLVWAPQLRGHWRRWLVASISALVSATPLLVVAFLERGQVAYLGTANYASWDVIFKQMWFGDTAFAWLGWAFVGAQIALGTARLFRSSSATPETNLFVMAASWAIVPTGLLLLANCVFPLFTARYAAITAPAVAILIGLSIDTLAGIVSRALSTSSAVAAVRIGVSLVMAGVVVAIAAPEWAAQRTPYAQNQSDWNTIAAVVRAGARPGDGIVFDPTAHPSRDTRLAYDTAPSGAFGPVRDLLVDTPASSNTTWYASTYSVDEAANRGRFSGVSRVWVVEYRTPTGLSGPRSPDTFGMSSLRALGYRDETVKRLHATVIYLFQKTVTSG